MKPSSSALPPFSLLIDDCGPVNPMHFSHPADETPLLVPNAFTRRYADLCAAHGVKGKFTVLPMPSCLGRIDGRLGYVSAAHLAGFLRIVRERIAPRCDITPEVLTHAAAFNLKSGAGYLHLFEDAWGAQASGPGRGQHSDELPRHLLADDGVALASGSASGGKGRG